MTPLQKLAREQNALIRRLKGTMAFVTKLKTDYVLSDETEETIEKLKTLVEADINYMKVSFSFEREQLKQELEENKT